MPTALITGASRGIGRELALGLARRGYDLLVVARSESQLQALAHEVQATHQRQAHMLALDLTQPDAASQVATWASQHAPGGLAVLINNAGYGQIGAVEEVSEQEVWSQFETNVFGSLWTIQAVLPVMREQNSGHIIQLSSALGLNTVTFMGLYSATKFAVEGLTETLSAEVAEFGIKVTLLQPGPYNPDFNGKQSLAVSEPITVYDDMKNVFWEHVQAGDSGNPEATVNALFALVDAENPPSRLILGKIALPWVKQTYEQRLKTWESWQDVSVAAHG
ncbi:MAG: SDR family NAD(P)-dependent oxidoreductase [Hymenobacter sp.]|nr:MAG: SDR family NAD(P)-dependent oxidoreductase [Hymenobacter sp.]